MSGARGPAPRHRGQSGVTLVEVLTAVVVGSLIMVPVIGVLLLTLKVREPASLSNAQDAQISLLKTRLQRDWASAMIIKTNLPFTDDTVCSGVVDGPQSNFARGPRIALQTIEPQSGARMRVVYFLRPTPAAEGGTSTSGGANSWDLVRTECPTQPLTSGFACEPPGPLVIANTGGVVPGSVDAPRVTEDYGCWRRDPRRVDDPGGSVEVVAQRISTVEVTSCNVGARPVVAEPWYRPCDATVTVTGIDGKMVTFSLFQQQWRFRSQLVGSGPATTLVPDDGPRN